MTIRNELDTLRTFAKRLARKHRSLTVVRLGPPPRLRGGFGATRYAYPLANGAGWVEERRFP